MDAHERNQTWRLVERKPGEKVISSRWILRRKLDQNGHVERLKARLVARGCSRVQGVDFEESFSPVVRFSTLRLLFACAAQNGWLVYQQDVEVAYLNGRLRDMELPEGYGRTDKVCLLQRPLYGLRQSGRLWFEKLNESLLGLGLESLETDPCLFRLIRGERVIIVTVYVNDLLVFTNDEDLRKEVC